MRPAVVLLLLLLAAPAWAKSRQQELPPVQPGQAGFDTPLTAAVLSAALAFIAPRALEPVSVQQLALWGLSAPASLDSGLAVDLHDGVVVLSRKGIPVFTHAAPVDDGADPAPGSAPGFAADSAAAAWGSLAADVLQAAYEVSLDARDAGTQGAISAFFGETFSHLDPYSQYVAPGAAALDRARRLGEAGAGIKVDSDRGAFVVVDVNANGPGAEAGVHPGDRILAVDGQPTAGESLDTVRGWIEGLEGTGLSLTVRSRGGPARTLAIERAVTPPETVFATRLNETLLLRIVRFSADTDQRLARELERNLGGATGRPIRGIVLDLRGNRGGLLRNAVAATGLLLDGERVASTAGRNPQAVHEWRSVKGDVGGGRPVIVLVDGRSASAAEIMAAALSDQGRGVVVGSATLGKGLVQTITTLPDGGELFVSWSRVLAPSGWPIQTLGILPQVCTSLGQDATIQQLRALDKGGQPMAAALARHRAARPPLSAAEALAIRNACPAAEARDADLTTARFLITHSAAYTTALSPPPP